MISFLLKNVFQTKNVFYPQKASQSENHKNIVMIAAFATGWSHGEPLQDFKLHRDVKKYQMYVIS